MRYENLGSQIKLEQKIRSGRLTKPAINNKGYNKYLMLDGKVTIGIDHAKFKQDAAWDGLKGYLTNTSLAQEEIISNYGQLWKIENAFRKSKSDLKIRPICHLDPSDSGSRSRSSSEAKSRGFMISAAESGEGKLVVLFKLPYLKLLVTNQNHNYLPLFSSGN